MLFRSHPWGELITQIESQLGSPEESEPSEFVRDLRVDDLVELINGAVSLASATAAKSSAQGAAPEDISRATKSVIDIMQQSSRKGDRSGNDLRQNNRVLWVDDQPNNNRYEINAFKSMGIEVDSALSTNQGLQMLSKQNYGAVISDMGRPEGSQEGYVLLEKVRRQFGEIPFIIYAGSNAQRHKDEAFRRGAQGSTNHPQELFEMVTQVLA